MEVSNAIDVPKTIALPIPWTTLEVIKNQEEGATAQSTVPNANTHIPRRNVLFLPRISASFPKGTRNTAAASRYDVGTQLRRTAFIENSSAMSGRAMLIEDAMNGVRNELIMASKRADRFSLGTFMTFIASDSLLPVHDFFLISMYRLCGR